MDPVSGKVIHISKVGQQLSPPSSSPAGPLQVFLCCGHLLFPLGEWHSSGEVIKALINSTDVSTHTLQTPKENTESWADRERWWVRACEMEVPWCVSSYVPGLPLIWAFVFILMKEYYISFYAIGEHQCSFSINLISNQIRQDIIATIIQVSSS